MQYLVVIEQGSATFGAHVPDLPGCVAVGETREETIDLIREAIEFHLEAIAEQGRPPPTPQFSIELVEVPDA